MQDHDIQLLYDKRISREYPKTTVRFRAFAENKALWADWVVLFFCERKKMPLANLGGAAAELRVESGKDDRIARDSCGQLYTKKLTFCLETEDGEPGARKNKDRECKQFVKKHKTFCKFGALCGLIVPEKR